MSTLRALANGTAYPPDWYDPTDPKQRVIDAAWDLVEDVRRSHGQDIRNPKTLSLIEALEAELASHDR